MKKTKNGENIIRIIIYAVLIAACVVLFIVFGKKQSEPACKPDEDGHALQDEKVPVPASCNDLADALIKSALPCELGRPAANDDGTIEYSLIFENKNDEGCIIIKPDKDFRAVRCEIRLNYFYDGIPPEGEINKVVLKEYERREKLHKALIEEYLHTVIPVLDYKDSVNSADVLTVTDAVMKSYLETKENAKGYDRSYGVLRINTHKSSEKPRSTFIIVITVKGK